MFSLLICHSTSLARKPIVFDAWLVLRLPQAFQHFPDWRLSTRRRRSWTLNGSTVPRTRETSVASSRCGWLMILPWPKKGSTIHWCPRQTWVVPGPFSPQTWSLWTCQELVMTMPCEMTLHRGSSRGQTSFVCVLGSTGRSRTRPRSSGSTNLCGTCPATMWPTWWQSVTTWVRTRSDATMGWDVALAARLQKSVTSSSRSSCQQNQCRCLLFRPGTMHDALVWRMEFPLRSWQKRPRRSQQCASTSSTQWSPARSRPSIRRLKDLGFMMARRKNPLPIACCFLIPTFLYLLQCYSPSGSTGQLSPSYATVFLRQVKGNHQPPSGQSPNKKVLTVETAIIGGATCFKTPLSNPWNCQAQQELLETFEWQLRTMQAQTQPLQVAQYNGPQIYTLFEELLRDFTPRLKGSRGQKFCEKIQAFHRITTSKKLICSLIWVVFVAYWYQNLFRLNQGISSCQSLREPLPHCQVQQAMPRNCTTNCSQKATIWKTQRRLASRQWGSRFLKMIVFRQWLCTCFGMGQRDPKSVWVFWVFTSPNWAD